MNCVRGGGFKSLWGTLCSMDMPAPSVMTVEPGPQTILIVSMGETMLDPKSFLA
jgi:hypothetical protein